METAKQQYPTKKDVRKIFLKELKEIVLKQKSKGKKEEDDPCKLTLAGLLEAVGDDKEVVVPKWFETILRKDRKIDKMFKSWEANKSIVNP